MSVTEKLFDKLSVFVQFSRKFVSAIFLFQELHNSWSWVKMGCSSAAQLLSPFLEYRDCFEPLRMVWHDTARSGPQLCGQTAIQDCTNFEKNVPFMDIQRIQHSLAAMTATKTYVAQYHYILMTGRQTFFTGRHKCRPFTMLKILCCCCCC